MRGGKRGARKGRERVLVENEDDIIARNMMVCVLGVLIICRKEMKEEREEMKNPKRKARKRATIPILLTLMNRMKNPL